MPFIHSIKMRRLATLLKTIPKISEPSDVYAAVYPLYYFCSIWGLAPYGTELQENGKRVYKNTLWPKIRSFVQICVFVAAVTINVCFRKISSANKLEYFQHVISMLVMTVEVIFSCVFATKNVQLFVRIDEIDMYFRVLGVWVPYKRIYIFILGNIAFSTGFIVVFAICSISYIPKEDDLLVQIYVIVTYILPYLYTVLILMQYRHYLNIVRIRFQLLNEYLQVLVTENSIQNEGWTISSTKSSVELIPKKTLTISDPLFVINQIASLHVKLTDAALLINRIFSFQLLIRITVTFVSLVIALFFIAVNISKAEARNEFTLDVDVVFTTWAFLNAMNVVGVVAMTGATCEEANTTPRLMHKIRNHTFNFKLQTTIETYSLQMFHNRLKFSVCGLFALDFTLVYMTIAGVATYLIILIQFNTSYFEGAPNKSDN